LAKIKNTRSTVFATRGDIDAAIEGLSLADERRIEKVAQYFVRGLGRLTRTRTFKELQQDAIAAIYVGAEDRDAGRHWPKDEVSFVLFFVRTMESIVSHWAEDAEREVLDSETVVETEEGESVSLLSRTPDPAPLPDRELIAQEEVRRILQLFDDDSEAWVVLESWRLGMKGPEIMREYGFSEKTLEATCKRIRYKVKA
jgi:predicted transcriptional regulator